MGGRDERRKGGLSEDDDALWKAFSGKIAPLPKRKRIAVEPAAPAAPPPVKQKAPPRAAPPLRSVPPPLPPPPALTPLDRRTKQRVKRGREEIGAKLDLHGHTQSEAHAGTLRFLRAASARGVKMALIITGKSGVLRQQVPQWLSLPEFRAFVIGFETAHVGHGGEGALYVRVRRAKN